MNDKFAVSAPWITLYREIEALFKEDPEVEVTYEDSVKSIKVLVASEEKADALTQIMPTEKQFGNVTVFIRVLPANEEKDTKIKLFQKAFKGNPALSYTASAATDVFDFSMLVFAKKVVQFFNDELMTVNVYKSMLYEDIARDVFEDHDGIYFTTEVDEG